MKLATLCYVREKGKTLMLHRIKKQNDMHAGKWNGLGGKLESGETPEECAIREVREESGLLVEEPRMRGVLTFPAFSNEEDWYVFLFTMHRFSGQLIDSPEGDLAWIHDSQLLKLNLWEGDRIFLRWLNDERFFSAKFVYEEGELRDHDVVFYEAQAAGSQTAEAGETAVQPATLRAPTRFQPVYRTEDDQICWLCNGPVLKRHCKIVCTACGFTRDCSDP
ncbi:MAG: 8-oxo-dGTP diphosphatase [Caldilineaceae bacterium]|nr:8-oxo-dGTP diphosphatase [Caldilineaceae bacterium]